MWATPRPLRASEDPSAPTTVATSVDIPAAAGTDDGIFPSFAGAFVTVPPQLLVLFDSPMYPDLLMRFAPCVSNVQRPPPRIRACATSPSGHAT